MIKLGRTDVRDIKFTVVVTGTNGEVYEKAWTTNTNYSYAIQTVLKTYALREAVPKVAKIEIIENVVEVPSDLHEFIKANPMSRI